MNGKAEDPGVTRRWARAIEFQSLRKYVDPMLGEVEVLKSSRTGELIAVRELRTTSELEAARYLATLRERQALNGGPMIRLDDVSTESSAGLCGRLYIIKGFYELSRLNLHTEMETRRRRGGGFAPAELAVILGQGLEALQRLQRAGTSHGDVRPETIGVEKSSSEAPRLEGVKLIDRLGDPSPLEQLQRNNKAAHREIFISPQLHRRLAQLGPPVSPVANDFFALGLTVLAAGLLEPFSELYAPAGVFREDRLEEKIAKFEARFPGNPKLLAGLRRLLRIDECAREDDLSDFLYEKELNFNPPASFDRLEKLQKPSVSSVVTKEPSSQFQSTHSFAEQIQPQIQPPVLPQVQSRLLRSTDLLSSTHSAAKEPHQSFKEPHQSFKVVQLSSSNVPLATSFFPSTEPKTFKTYRLDDYRYRNL